MRAAQSVASIATRLGSAYRAGSWWRCRCPGHRSIGSTLALRDGPHGLIVYCHGGCRRDDVIAELGRLGLLDDEHIVGVIEIARHHAAEERDRQRRIAAALGFGHHDTADPHGTVVER
jgi:hypothetical protein